MDFNVQKKISNFIQSQFPSFYNEEGDVFILFVKTYYEWLEQQGNVTLESRNLLSYRDIDATLDTFLEHFQKKYLYGIPFDVIINKRYLLKHILDVYRSKSSIQGYRLLFRLIYDEDIEVYLPGRDVLKASDGTWTQPKYIELSYTSTSNDLIGKEIEGSFSGTTAVVETIVTEYFEQNKINIAYISNVLPKSGDFSIGEKLVLKGQTSNAVLVAAAPTVLGSLYSIDIINGGQDFAPGDNIKIMHIEGANTVSHGIGGILKVDSISKGVGSLFFNIVDGGWGYTTNALTWVYNNDLDTTGNGGSFSISEIINPTTLVFNTDVLATYLGLTLDSTYGLPSLASANLNSTIASSLAFSNAEFGKIFSLQNIRTGQNYTQAANCFVRSTIDSEALTGNVSYNSASKTITGTGTTFTNYFANGDCIKLKANNSLANTVEYHLIKTVTNATSMSLYGYPSKNSTSSAKHYVSPVALQSNFATYEIDSYVANNSTVGENERIVAYPSLGNSVVNAVSVVESGKGYLKDEYVKLYLHGTVNSVSIANGGTGYTNGDIVMFISTKLTGTTAEANVTTNTTGGIVTVTINDKGSGYIDAPVLRMRSNTGSGAILESTIKEFDTTTEILGKVVKAGIGKSRGYWQSTRGFLNSDKYIHDSYYYQDFSYEIRVALPLAKYRDILYETFHVAGTELFGKFVLYDLNSSNTEILSESVTVE